MEPRSPFDHHRLHHHPHHHQEIDNRYASLPPPPPLPPRFPDDRDFYPHHHHNHHPPPQHERLPPPPPPLRPRPPPPPQHPSFQYHPEPRYPIEDRRPTFEFNPPPPPPPEHRPYPPSNRIPFDDRHHLPRILDNHPRLREPPDVWPPPQHPHPHPHPHQLPPPPPPPRVSVDTRTIRWDHQPHHPPLSPYNQDHTFRDFKRFVDEDDHLNRQEAFLFRKKDEFLWGERDRRDGREGTAPLLGTFDSIPSGSSSSRFTFGKGRFDSNGEESLGENVRWGSAKPFQREMEEPLGENVRWGPPQRETEEKLGENIRWGSAKPPQREMSSFGHKQPVEIEGDEMESEHWSNEDGLRNFNGKHFHKPLKFGKPKNNGGSQEFVVYNPKKKVQRTSALLRVGKTPTRWKEEEEVTFPVKYFEDSNAGSPSHRRIAFSDEIMDQSKSEGSVDLDVSFKSNALVAKAIVPPGHVVGSDVTSTPNNQKRRKVESPVFSVSSPRVTEIHEMSLNGDGSRRLLGAASSSKKSLTPSKDKVTALRVGSSIGVSSLPCPDTITMPVDKNIAGSIPPFSAAMGSDNKPLNGESSTQNVNVTSSSSKIAAHSKNKSSTSGTGTVGGITSMSSPNKIFVPLEKSRKSVTSSGAETSNKRSLNEDNLTLTLGAGSTCNEGLTQSCSDVIIPGIGARNDTPPYPNGISITHEKGPIEITPISTLSCPDKRDSPTRSAKIMQSNSNVCTSSNGIGTADDIGSLLSLSVTGKTPSSTYYYGKNSPNQYIYAQNPDTALSFEKDLCPTHARRKIIYAENGVGDVDSPTCLDGTTALLSTIATEKTTLDSVVGFSNTLNGENSTLESDDVSVFDKGLCLTQSKDMVSIAGLGGGNSNPCQSGVSVPIEMTMTEKKGLSTTIDFYGKSSNSEWSIQKLGATSSSDKGLAHSKGDITISGLEPEDDIASHLSLNKIPVPLESAIIENTSTSTILSSDKNTVIEGSTPSQDKGTKSGCGLLDVTCSHPCLKGLAETSMAERTHLGLTVDSDVVSTPKTKKRNRKKKKKVDASDSSFPSSATEDVPVVDMLTVVSTTNMSVIGLQSPVTEVNYEVVSGDSPGKNADITRNFVKNYKKSEEDTAFAGDEIINGVCLHTSNNVVNTSLEKRNIMVLLPSSSGLSQTELVKADKSIDHEKSNLCAAKGFVQPEEVTVCGTGLMDNVGLQSLQGMDLSLENSSALTSLPSPVTGLAGTKKRKRRKKKKKGMDPGLSSTIAADTHEKVATQNANYALPADSGLRQSEDQASVSATKMINNVDLQLLQRHAASPENSAAAKSLQSSINDCAEVPKVKRKNVFERLSGFPSTGATKIHGRPRDSDRPNYCADVSSSPQKLTPESEEINTVSRNGRIKDDLQSIHGAATMIGNMAEVEAHPNPVFASADTSKVEKKIKTIKKIKKVKKVKKIKKKQTLVDSISVSRSSPDNAMSCHGGTTAASISYEGQKKSDVETLDDVHSDSLHVHPSSIDTSLEEKSPTNMISVRNDVNKDDGRNSAEQYMISSSFAEASSFPDGHSASAKSNVICSSLVEDSVFLNTYSSPSLGFAGGLNGVVNPFLPVENSLQYALPDDRIESEGAADVDAAGKDCVLGKEIAKDIAVSSLGKEKVDNLCGELQGSMFNERSQGKATEGDLDSLPVRADSSSLYACVSPREEASGTSITNSNEEGVDSFAERRGSIDDQHCKSTVQDLQILDSQHFQCRLPTRQISDTERNLKSNQTAEAEYVVPRKTLALPSLPNQQSTYTLRPKVGTMIGKKTCQDPSVSKVLPARASFSSGYIKKSDSVTRPAGPRTWHRTNTPQPQKVSCPTAAHSQRPSSSVKKTQSMSYIRKGNSLVRKFAPVATTTQVSGGLSTSNSLLSQACRDESRSTVSGNKEVNCLGTKNYLTSGLERPKTPLLPHNVKLPIGPKKAPQVTASSPLPSLVLEGAFESTSDPAYIKADNCIGASENQNGMNKESENQGLLDDGKSLSSKMKEITYVKRKSNQLVASCNTQFNGCSSSAETTQSPCLSTPSDQYYKKNKNQLIRTAPSLRSHLKQAAIPDDSSNSESQKASKVSSSNKNINKRKLDRAFVKRRKPSKFSLVWTLHETQAQKEDTNPLQRLKVYPYLFPWKRTTQWRNFKFNLVSNKSSFSRISKKLLLSRKRDTLYTRSTGGFSLRKSKVLSIGGSNLKWSKSIESRSKKANEEATLAVAAVERKKREQKGANCTVPTGKRRNQSSRERIFRIGSVRYKMDASKCTLQRIPDEESAGTVERPGDGTRKSFIPKRLLIDNDEYIRIGNGNKLVRDPKKLVRILASEKVRWSLHTARLRLARKQQYCQFFTRFGKCNKGDGKCPYIHDPAKIAVCTKFLKGLCSNTSCKLTHEVIPERMEDCSYFLQGLCTNRSCPYRHVNVNPNASVCEGFLRGYCANGNECRKKHSYVCPIFKSTGICPRRSLCKLHHPKNRSRNKKRSKASKSTKGRYFGSKVNDTDDRGTTHSDKVIEKNDGDIFIGVGRHSEYISLDVSDEEEQDTNGSIGKYTVCDSDSSDLQSDELDELIKPVRLMNKTPN